MKITLYRPIATGATLLGLLASAVPASAAPHDQQPSPAEVTPSVVGGHDATEDYPGMATLQYSRNGPDRVREPRRTRLRHWAVRRAVRDAGRRPRATRTCRRPATRWGSHG
ncbi:hypothetical protein ACIG87_30830 [Micromonospora sp. NPDC051925]|uniref:hypothetical protein n=1 Tax=Micromonospora sp. NPDC051925 TaxID=3364288 RepID=UPI0037C722CB